MNRKNLLRRVGIPLVSVGIAVLIGGAAAFANGPYSYDFGINGAGGVACTSQTQTASSTLAPYIEVELTGISPSGQTTANFTAANTNCSMLSGANWQGVILNNGYYAIDVNDTSGQSIKLMGGTSVFQTSITVQGYWKT
ncbi:MAG: hypothetical protein ACYCOS_03855 [Sulfobacillus sp.]